jgi:hypothetical protein
MNHTDRFPESRAGTFVGRIERAALLPGLVEIALAAGEVEVVRSA